MEWGGTNVSDNAPNTNNESTTAIGTTLAYADGIWFNPRQRGVAGFANTLQGGKYYVPEFRSEIKITGNATVNSVNSVPFYAKDGGKITTQNITINGNGGTGVMAYAELAKAATITGAELSVDKLGNPLVGASQYTNWSSEDAYIGPTTTVNINGIPTTLTSSSVLPKTEVFVKGNINATSPKTDGSGNLYNNNTGAVASVLNGTNGAEVIISGNVLINGIGAIAKGTNAYVEINGANSNIKTGNNGALVSINGGKIKFGGGIIEHKETYTGTHDDKLAFYAQSGSNIDFAETTTVNIYNGVVFYGAKNDYSGSSTLGVGETGRYTKEFLKM